MRDHRMIHAVRQAVVSSLPMSGGYLCVPGIPLASLGRMAWQAWIGERQYGVRMKLLA